MTDGMLVEKLRSCMLQDVPRNQTAGLCSSLPYDAADEIERLADRLSSLEEEKRVLREALTTVCARATEFRAQAERAGRPSQAQWRGIEQVASTALSAGVGPLHTPMMENR